MKTATAAPDEPRSNDYAARAAARVDRSVGNSIAHAANLSDGWGESQTSGAQPYNWLHVPHLRPLPVVVLCESPVSYRGHWWQAAMHACTGDGACPMCERGVGAQIRVILTVYDLKLRAIGLLELSTPPASEIRRLAEDRGHLRGLVVELSKEAGRPRGRVIVAASDPLVPNLPDPLPAGPDIRTALTACWARAQRRAAQDAQP